MHELLLPLNSKKIGGFRTADRSYLRGGLGNSKRYKCSDVRSSGSRARPVSKEVIPDGCRDVARWAAGGRICPHYDSKEEGVRGPPSPAVLGRERQGRLIGTRQQWVRAAAEDDRMNVAPSHLPRRRGSSWICDSDEQRERVWPPLSCLDLERTRQCEESNTSKQARRLLPI